MSQNLDIPKTVLNQLGEHTVGGYALFYFNPQTGIPQHILNFDSPAHCLAMFKYIGDWDKALEAVYLENAKSAILHAASSDDDDEAPKD